MPSARTASWNTAICSIFCPISATIVEGEFILPQMLWNGGCPNLARVFCLDHRSKLAHKCTDKARKARESEEQRTLITPSPKPNLRTHNEQCYEISCKTLINTPLSPPNECTSCNRSYCLKHRFPENHDCKNVPRRGAAVTSGKGADRECATKGHGMGG